MSDNGSSEIKALRLFASTNLVNHGIDESSPIFGHVMSMLTYLETCSRHDWATVATLVSKLARLENLPIKEAQQLIVLNSFKKGPKWQEFLFKTFPPSEFITLPPYMREQSAMWRLASAEDYVSDTIHCYGTQMPAGLSMLFKPKTIVEFGVHSGCNTLLFCKLNPNARVFGVDICSKMPDAQLPTGIVPLMHGVTNLTLMIMNSWECSMPGNVDLCFIDADHTGAAPYKDSWRAWHNRNINGDWCIAWDDYTPANPHVWDGINRFISEVGHTLKRIGSWVWIGTKSQEDLDEVMV